MVTKSDFLGKNINPLNNAIETHQALQKHSLYGVYLDSLLGWHREVSQMSSAHVTNHKIPKFDFLGKKLFHLEMLRKTHEIFHDHNFYCASFQC